MVFELAVVETETTVVKRAITKSLARTTQTAAKKKKPAKKAAKKPKAKKAKKAKKTKKKKKKKKKKKRRKKKKAKKLRYPGGHRVKHAPKSKKKSAAGKKSAAAMKKGVGLFKPVTQSAALAKVTGISGKASRLAITKAVWAYIKKKGLNKGRNVGKIDGIFGGGSMFKLAGAVAKHVK